MQYKFDQPYSRPHFVAYLQDYFLPDDFQPTEQPVPILSQVKYTSEATLLGHSEDLDLNVYEIKHHSINDARVGLSNDAFRFLAQHQVQRALVAFIPLHGETGNYRFSFIEIGLSITDTGAIERTYSNPRRYSYYLGHGIATYTAHKYLLAQGRVTTIEELRSRFSVEVLTKAFYTELSDWYAWAVKEISFPNDLNNPADDQQYNEIGGIRLITRLIFVWFLKQMGLVPQEFFDEEYIHDNLIKGFTPHANYDLFGKSRESKYYKGILQNLFFAMLNSPITEGGDQLVRRFSKRNNVDHSNHKLMRHEDYFIDPSLFIELANKYVPFLNGGLFECLDDSTTNMYFDGFSDNPQIHSSVIVPDYLFFGEEMGKDIDLSEWYGDKNKKKVSARGIIDILKRYNFTVEENMPFDQEVSLDPELLGKVFENLLASVNPETKDTARKETGSFYTPREVVHFMVAESLQYYLKQSVSDILQQDLRELLEINNTETHLPLETRKAIIEALFNAKILDPACGSGAFPMGMLQQIVHLLNILDPDNILWKELMIKEASNASSEAFKTESKEDRDEILRDINRSFDESLNRPDYARKLYVIEHCIYGADIQPIAIQISKLRFFISLVVDQLKNNNPTDNFGIRPLPNLETKFVAANTLMKVERNRLADNRLIALQRKLQTAYHKIFTAKTYRTKKKYKELIYTLRSEMAEILTEDDAFSSETINNLVHWDMFDQNIFAPFFDPEWMLGVSDGFDIVIGNPPYIQMQKNRGELSNLYKPYNYLTFERTGDIYTLFYERGCELLKPHGHLCYITSNKWMRAGYGESTRHYFATKTDPKFLIDFAGIKIFESATVDTNILLFEKLDEAQQQKNSGKTLALVTKKKDVNGTSNLSVYLEQKGALCDFRTSDPWIILSPIEQSIKRKIEAVGTPLKDWDIQINYGVKTGCNEAFIITTDKREEILANCQTEEERSRTEALIRPILRGRDIKRYGYKWANLWIIATHNGVKGQFDRINIDDYPAVKAHLDQFWEEISKRSDKGDTPYNLRNCAYWEDFNKPKIIYQELTQGSCFVLDNDGEYMVTNSAYLITGQHLEYLISMLNSDIIEFAYKTFYSTRLGGSGVRWLAQNIINLPIPLFDANNPNQLLIVREEKSNLEGIIATIYNLNEEEIQYINNLSSQYRSE